MLYREFAIEPSQIKNLSDLRLLESRFGYEKGSLISAFPSAWLKDAITGLQSGQEATQIDRLTDLLRGIQQKALHRYGRPFSCQNWRDSANLAHQTKPFHRIVEPTQHNPPIYIQSLYELSDPDFSLITHCKRTAQDMSSVAEELLVDTEKVTIVDAFATPEKVEYIKTITEIANKTKKAVVELVIFSEEEKQQNNFAQREILLNSLVQSLPNSIKLTWCFISDNDTGYIHPRALFTAKGGINFDRGFNEPRDIDKKNGPNFLSILTKAQLEKFSLDYNFNHITAPLKIEHVWQSA